MTYVDGFVFPVPKNKLAAFKKMAEFGRKTWMKYGALDYKECQQDDIKVKPQGGMRTRAFKEMAKAGPNDLVFFSFVVYKDKKHRDEVNKKVMSDPKMSDPEWFKKNPMPFDMKKMAVGGFKTIAGK